MHLAFPVSISPAVPHPGPLAMVEKPGGYLKQSWTGNLWSICSFNAKSKSKTDQCLCLPSDVLTQHRGTGWDVGVMLCQPFKGGCDHSEKYPKQGLSYWWVLHIGQEQLPVRKKKTALEASVMLFLFPELPAGWEKIEDPVYGVYYVE